MRVSTVAAKIATVTFGMSPLVLSSALSLCRLTLRMWPSQSLGKRSCIIRFCILRIFFCFVFVLQSTRLLAALSHVNFLRRERICLSLPLSLSTLLSPFLLQSTCISFASRNVPSCMPNALVSSFCPHFSFNRLFARSSACLTLPSSLHVTHFPAVVWWLTLQRSICTLARAVAASTACCSMMWSVAGSSQLRGAVLCRVVPCRVVSCREM